MKKNIIILLSAGIMTACTTIDKVTAPTSGEYLANADGYQLLETQRTESVSKEYFFLFIPFGGKGDATMQNECLNTMMKNANSDGVFNQTYMITRTRYPFYRKTVTELSGRPYKLKGK